MDEAIVSTGPGQYVSENQAENCTQEADKKSLHQKNTTNLARLYTQRHQHGNILRLLHHHHGQRNENIKRRHAHDKTDDNEGDYLFELQCAEELPVLLHPVRCFKSGAGSLLDLLANTIGVVQIVDLERDH